MMGTRGRRTRKPSSSTLPMSFARAISRGETDQVLPRLEKNPELARAAAAVGATRTTAPAYFLAGCGHYIYTGDTALHVAAAGYQVDLARELIARGASVSARNRRGAEPLHYAADGNPGAAYWNPAAQAAIIELLIAAGADPNAEAKGGVTPLHRAVRTRCAAAVRALLASGADAGRPNGRGSTPRDLAVRTTGRGGSGSELAREQQAEIVRLLAGNTKTFI